VSRAETGTGPMNAQPTILTRRLVLRPFVIADAKDVMRLAGDKSIAANTLNIPHPYQAGMAEEWIASHPGKFEKGELANFAITLAADQSLIGAIGLTIVPAHFRAELGYWIGRPFWGNGFATESGKAVLKYGFETLGLERIHAGHFSNNPASGKVMEKLGMRHEGALRKHVFKSGEFIDLENYAVLKEEFQTLAGAGS